MQEYPLLPMPPALPGDPDRPRGYPPPGRNPGPTRHGQGAGLKFDRLRGIVDPNGARAIDPRRFLEYRPKTCVRCTRLGDRFDTCALHNPARLDSTNALGYFPPSRHGSRSGVQAMLPCGLRQDMTATRAAR